jgi:hypothetical protein
MHSARAALQSQSVGQTFETAGPKTYVFGGTKSSVVTSGSSLTFNARENEASIETFDESRRTFTVYKAKLNAARSFFNSIPFPAVLEGFPQGAQDLDGHVLVVGGLSNGGLTNFGEAIDPVNIEDSTSNLNMPMMFDTATFLDDGTVLIAGGIVDSNGDMTNSAELFTPSNFQYTILPSTMTVPRAGHSATLLQNGDVLIAGGVTGSKGSFSTLNSAEIYDPNSQTFTAVGNLSQARVFHSATLMSDGTVLVAGGSNGANVSLTGDVRLTLTSLAPLGSAEIYDPSAQTFTCVGGSSDVSCQPSMISPRLFQTTTPLSDGSILFAGGFAVNSKGKLQAQNSAELYSGRQFSATGNLIHARALQAAVVLP